MRLKFIVKNDSSFIQQEQRIFAIPRLSINKPLFTTCDTDLYYAITIDGNIIEMTNNKNGHVLCRLLCNYNRKLLCRL
ncbi:MAG: hypothetical protein LBJ13_01325 [Puniceicoccales bacterium]|nr:hypothetical protein [Puniceicoccales bacterium]